MALADCRLVELARFTEARGNLTVLERAAGVPFEIRRVFFLDGVPGNARRGGHAHRRYEQLIVAQAGSFELELDDGEERRRVRLDRPDVALYVSPMIWHTLDEFSPGAICLVLASEPYDETDYLRDYGEFLAAVREVT